MLFNKSAIVSVFTQLLLNEGMTGEFTRKHFEDWFYHAVVDEKNSNLTRNTRIERYHVLRSMYECILNNIKQGRVSRKAVVSAIDKLISPAILGYSKNTVGQRYTKEHNVPPPYFMVLSPTQRCNLNCAGCYASSLPGTQQTLEWPVVERIISEAHNLMGMRFFVISGGEPLLYESEGKKIFDLAEQFNSDAYFLMYTNGTLITNDIARRLADLGNLTPAVSLEGFEDQTDKRRGKGTYGKIMNAFEKLCHQGVPFGISVTVTPENIDLMLSDRFYEYCFDTLGATYMWMFHYMPIGREFAPHHMITPEQRFELFKKCKKVIREHPWFIADFWNSAHASRGCISCAKGGNGYFYIDWNGNIMPCVFVPYFKDNVRNLYAQNKTLVDALFSDFFAGGRSWQQRYIDRKENLLRPCLFRDHHGEFMDIAQGCNVKPQDDAARHAMEDTGYHAALEDFGSRLAELTDAYWREYFVESGETSGDNKNKAADRT
ncbi:MAG: radical SAM protein [Chitinivibrionales bacterium]|nr:radical SAM protein [Chitinivibrionales bacterium]